VRIWRLSDASSTTLYGHEGPVRSVAFNPKGDRVLSSGQDGTVRIWDAVGGDTLVVLQTHEGAASGAAFSPDGSRVVSVGDDDLLRISTCDVCGSARAILGIAQRLPQRVLSLPERRRYLPGG